MKTITITNDNSYSAFPSASTMPDGRVAVLYHKAANHVSPDAKMVCRVGSPAAQSWGPEVVVGSDDTFSEQGGCIKALRDGTLLAFTWCLQVTNATTFQSVGLGKCRRSTDGGKTWSSPVAIGGCVGYTSMEGGALELADGTVLLPVFGQDPSVVRCKVMQSIDKGLSWTVRGIIDQTNSLVEVCLLEVNPGGTATGVLLASMRNQATLQISFSRSADAGATWSPKADLFPGASTAPLLQMPSGALLCCYRSMSQLNYSQMAFRISLDGLAWSDESVLLDAGTDGFEYADLIMLDSGKIGVVFSQQSGPNKATVRILIADEAEFGIQPTGNFQGISVSNGDARLRNANLWMQNTNGIHYVGMLTNGYCTGELRLGGASPGWCGQIVLSGRANAADPGSISLNPTEGGSLRINGPMVINSTVVIPTFTDNQNAKDNGLGIGRPFKTPAGDLKIVV